MSGWYNDGLTSLLARTIPDTAGIYIVGVNEDYVYDPTHTTSAAFDAYVLLPEVQLTNCTYENGILKADSPSWSAAGAGVLDKSLVLKAAIFYFKEGSTGTLLAYIDSASVGLPQTLTGVDIVAHFDPRGILKI